MIPFTPTPLPPGQPGPFSPPVTSVWDFASNAIQTWNFFGDWRTVIQAFFLLFLVAFGAALIINFVRSLAHDQATDEVEFAWGPGDPVYDQYVGASDLDYGDEPETQYEQGLAYRIGTARGNAAAAKSEEEAMRYVNEIDRLVDREQRHYARKRSEK